MKQRTFDQHTMGKSALAAAVIMAMTRLGQVETDADAEALFADMMRSSEDELRAARERFEAELAARGAR